MEGNPVARMVNGRVEVEYDRIVPLRSAVRPYSFVDVEYLERIAHGAADIDPFRLCSVIENWHWDVPVMYGVTRL